MKKIETEVLVIGSGVAGLSYALQCSRFASVLIITKGSIGESNTMYAQGGIAAVMDQEDSIEEHIEDTLTAGDGLCDAQSVRLIAEKAPESIRELAALSVPFDKSLSGTFDLHREGGHSRHRIVHAADATGMAVETSLVKQVRATANITILENCFAVDLNVHDNVCTGALAIDKKNNTLLQINAGTVMLASGGAGQVFARNTNPAVATGDGYAMAYRAGATLGNMEFVQFHPTTFYKPGSAVFLITEAVRGFGVELKTKSGEAFMEKYHPLKSLAPRDVVTRAIINELQKSGDECVYLDTTPFSADLFRKHFPNIYNYCTAQGLDISREMIPVVPAAHYMCGGVITDTNGRTSVEQLYACGEVSCTGVHGANRLASNSLLEGLVFAKQAAIDTERNKTVANASPLPPKPARLSKVDGVTIKELKAALPQFMWEKAGIIRNGTQMKEAEETLKEYQQELRSGMTLFGITIADMELLNMVETSLLIVRGALQREESRGCHYRSDFPDKYTHPEVIKQSCLETVFS